MSDLFQEIMDDVRADRAGELWKKYGKWVIYAAVSIVIVTAAVVFWNYHKRETAMRETAIYLSATEALEKGDGTRALALLDGMSVSGKSPFYSLVLLKKSQSLEAMGKHDDAKKMLVELAARNDIYGDIGKVMLGNADAPKEAAPLLYTRSEWAAWDLVAKGDNAKAAEQFALLAKKENAPANLRERAHMMANYLRNQGGTAHE